MPALLAGQAPQSCAGQYVFVEVKLGIFQFVVLDFEMAKFGAHNMITATLAHKGQAGLVQVEPLRQVATQRDGAIVRVLAATLGFKKIQPIAHLNKSDSCFIDSAPRASGPVFKYQQALGITPGGHAIHIEVQAFILRGIDFSGAG